MQVTCGLHTFNTNDENLLFFFFLGAHTLQKKRFACFSECLIFKCIRYIFVKFVLGFTLPFLFKFILVPVSPNMTSRDSSFGTATGWTAGVPLSAINFSLLHNTQTSSVSHPASYPMGTDDSFPGGKATVA
jgi:hypothetical protein